jgi:hypothetical protein
MKKKLKLTQSYCKSYHIYKDNCNMDQQPSIWTDIILTKPKVHMRYKSMVLEVATQGGAPQSRPNMEPRDTQWKNPLVKKLTNPRNLLVARLVHIPRREERRGNIPRAMTLKSLRNSNHPLSAEKLRRGKKHKFGCLA